MVVCLADDMLQNCFQQQSNHSTNLKFFLARCVYKHLKLFGIKISILDFVLLKKVGKRKGFEKVVGKSGLASTSRQSLFLYFYTFCISQLFLCFSTFLYFYILGKPFWKIWPLLQFFINHSLFSS